MSHNNEINIKKTATLEHNKIDNILEPLTMQLYHDFSTFGPHQA